MNFVKMNVSQDGNRYVATYWYFKIMAGSFQTGKQRLWPNGVCAVEAWSAKQDHP